MRPLPILPISIWKVLTILSLTSLFVDQGYSKSSLQSLDGIFDLSHWDFEKKPIAEIHGKVPFYWNTYIQSEKIKVDSEPYYIDFPGTWSQHPELPLYGYGTYEIAFINRKEQLLTLDLNMTVGLAHRVYLNGQLVDQSGEPGKSWESTTPGMVRLNTISFKAPPGPFKIHVEVSNFSYSSSGIGMPVFIGRPEGIMLNRFRSLSVGILLFGAYLAMGVYHLGLYSLRRRDRSSLYFGLFCLSLSPSALQNLQGNFYELIGEMSVVMGTYLASFGILGASFLGLFLAYLYKSMLTRWIAIANAVSYIIYGFLILGDDRIFYAFLSFQVLVAVILGISIATTLFKSVRKNKPGARMILMAICILILTAVNDFLNFSKIIDSIALSHFGSLAFLMIQSYMLSKRFSDAFFRLEKSEIQIRSLSDEIKAENARVIALNENLEQLALEKSRDIRSMMETIQLGIFTVGIEGCRIQKDHSKFMRELFEKEKCEGERVQDMLFENSNLTSDEISQADACLRVSLGENILGFYVNEHCLPREMKYKSSSGKIKLLEMTWHPMLDDLDVVRKILVTVKDITEIRALQDQSKDKEEELQFIRELINVTPDSFRRFIQNAKEFMEENRKLVNSISLEQKDMEVLKILFINMHTIKGAARSLYFKKMTQVFHDIEQYYAELQKNRDVMWDFEKMNQDLDEADSIIALYVSIAQEKLGRSLTKEVSVELPITKIEHLYDQSCFWQTQTRSTPRNHTFLSSLKEFFIETIFFPLRETIEETASCLPALARDLGKEQPDLVLNISEAYLSRQGEALVRRVLIHLLRNSMDHGIETAAERSQGNKNPRGTIRIDSQEQSNSYQITYQDDGRGLNIQSIYQAALNQHTLNSKVSKGLSSEEIAELIFYSGLSTANRLSDISGRGVGMSAVRNFLESHRASINIHLLTSMPLDNGCYPFLFKIELPIELFADLGRFTTTSVAV